MMWNWCPVTRHFNSGLLNFGLSPRWSSTVWCFFLSRPSSSSQPHDHVETRGSVVHCLPEVFGTEIFSKSSFLFLLLSHHLLLTPTLIPPRYTPISLPLQPCGSPHSPHTFFFKNNPITLTCNAHTLLTVEPSPRACSSYQKTHF